IRDGHVTGVQTCALPIYAILSGMLAAEHAAEALSEGRANDELASYDAAWRDGHIGRDLWRVRNAKPLWSKLGTFLGIAAGGFDKIGRASGRGERGGEVGA